ncbi:MAG: MBL fold metallo-hydrolase [Miltoncostaeaceae bacterium]
MTPANERPLELLPIGAGAAYGRPDETQSAHLVRGAGAAVLLDLGAGSLNVLAGVMPPEDLDLIVISHLHADHVVDLLSLRVYMAWGPGRGGHVPVLGPPGLRDLLVSFAGDDGWEPGLTFEEIPAAGERRAVGDLDLTLRQVPHLDPTYAVRVDGPSAALCYGADCSPSDALVQLARGCGLLVAECSFGTGDVPGEVPHLNASMAGDLARRADVGRLALTHVMPEFDAEAAVAQAASAFGGSAEWARSGIPLLA